MFKRVELVANLAIIGVAVLLAIVVVRIYLTPAPQEEQKKAVAAIRQGTQLSLPGLDWTENRPTLLLVLSTTCRYCTESAAFYQRLVQARTQGGDIRLVAVFPQQVADGQKYLRDLAVSVDEIKQAAPDLIGASGTPTLVMTDSKGAVTESWLGKLSTDKEVEVLSHFK
jgi:hypothetical protein